MVMQKIQSVFYNILSCLLLFFAITGKAESDGIAKFLLEINERWKNVSVELRCIQSLLEEVIAYWKKFLDLTEKFEAWLDRSFTKVKLPEKEKMIYFQVKIIKEIHSIWHMRVSHQI